MEPNTALELSSSLVSKVLCFLVTMYMAAVFNCILACNIKKQEVKYEKKKKKKILRECKE